MEKTDKQKVEKKEILIREVLTKDITKKQYSKIQLRHGTCPHKCNNSCKQTECYLQEPLLIAEYDGKEWTFNGLTPTQTKFIFSSLKESKENKKPVEVGKLKHTYKTFWTLPKKTQNDLINLGVVKLPFTGNLYNFSEKHPLLTGKFLVDYFSTN